MESVEQWKDILLADDDQEDAFLFEEVLLEIGSGIKLRVARDGNELFEELDTSVPNLLFLDINMPCRNGLDCLELIRQDERFEKLPVIMFSSLALDSYIERSLKAGANFFLAKPTLYNDWITRLRNLSLVPFSEIMNKRSVRQFVI